MAQNRAAEANSVPQPEQNFLAGAASGAPHSAQNRPTATLAAHLGHVVVPPAGVGAAAWG